MVSAPLPNAASASGPCAARIASSRSAMKSSAASQLAGAKRPSDPRRSGVVTRSAWSSRSAEVNPLVHIWPRLTGNASSGRTSSACETVIPHWNAQYGQCVRVRERGE